MGKRRWIAILAVVAALTLLIAGTAYAAQGGNGPLGRTGSTITPSTTCSTCIPSTTCTGTCDPTQAQSQTQQRLQTGTCDGTCDRTAASDQTRLRLQDGTGTGSSNGYGYGSRR